MLSPDRSAQTSDDVNPRLIETLYEGVTLDRTAEICAPSKRKKSAAAGSPHVGGPGFRTFVRKMNLAQTRDRVVVTRRSPGVTEPRTARTSVARSPN